MNKWAAWISANYVINQLVLPFVYQGLAANRVFTCSVEELRAASVRVLFGPGEFVPHLPRTGDRVPDSYPWAPGAAGGGHAALMPPNVSPSPGTAVTHTCLTLGSTHLKPARRCLPMNPRYRQATSTPPYC
jgi:hypothetical protein